MTCDGLVAENYDLYVLGLLEGPAAAVLEEHLRSNCAVCIRGVQRSTNLWIMFATTLDDPEPSANLRQRVIKLADLSKRAVHAHTANGAPKSDRRPSMRWGFAAVAATLAALLVGGAWYAGHRSGTIQVEQLAADLSATSRQLSLMRLALKQQTASRREAEAKATTFDVTSLRRQQSLQNRRVQQLEAQINQYKAALNRQTPLLVKDARLVTTLALPGVHFVPMKADTSAGSSVAYALLVEDARVLLVAADLPPLPSNKQFQLWLLRRKAPTVVSGGVFTADSDRRALVEFQDSSATNGIQAIAITDEPAGGSELPTGTKLFVGSLSR